MEINGVLTGEVIGTAMFIVVIIMSIWTGVAATEAKKDTKRIVNKILGALHNIEQEA